MVSDRMTVSPTELLVNLPVASQQPGGVLDVDHYKLSYRPMLPSGWWAEWWREFVNELPVGNGDEQKRFRFSGLLPSSRYQLRVRAYNKDGVASWPSAPVVAITRSRGE